jgi:hypothetical protein
MLPLVSADPPTIGDFALLARLGAGGMGQLYLGRRPDGSAAALKLIRPDLAHQPDFRARFRREITVAGQAAGPHTARVIAADPDGTPPWLAVEYVPGPSLAEVVGEHGKLPVEAARVLMAGLSAGLTQVHGLGLVHRDLKPGNVLVTADGPRIIDFGVSRVLDSSTITQTGQLVGSPGFMSPEQALGTGPVGAPTDVFSLGALMTFVLTGTSPFGGGQTAAVVYRVVHEPPSLDDVPDTMRDLLADCLAKDPADRPTAAQVLDRLAPGGMRAGWLPAPVMADIERRTAELRALDEPLRSGPDETVLRARRRTEPAPQPPTSSTARSRGRMLAFAGAGVVAVLAVAGGAAFAVRGAEPGTAARPDVAERKIAAQRGLPTAASSSPRAAAPPAVAAAGPKPSATAEVPEAAAPAAIVQPEESEPRPKTTAVGRKPIPEAPRRTTAERAAVPPAPIQNSVQRTPAGCIRITIRNPGPAGPDPEQMLEVVSVSGGKLMPRMANEVAAAARQVWFACGSGNVTTIRPAAVKASYCLTETSGSSVGIRPCDQSAAQSWNHRFRGKDPQNRDHWVMISAASSRVLEINAGSGGQPKTLRVAEEKDFSHRQLFWYWQA